VVALARALAEAAAAATGPAEDARAMYELAVALGADLDADDLDFLDRFPARVMASDEAYPGTLPPAEVRALIDDDDDGPLAAELEALWEASSLLCPGAAAALAGAGFGDAERAQVTSHAAAPALYPQVVRALGGPVTLLYATRARGAADVTLLLAAPPVVVLGPGLAARRAQSHSDADADADAELRFALGRMVELARPRRIFAAGVEPDQFGDFLAALRGQGGDADRLRAALPVKLRTRLAERLPALSPADLDPQRYLAACQRAADRSGLLACGNAAVAIAHAGGPAAAPHLVRMAASSRYLAARRILRGATPRRG